MSESRQQASAHIDTFAADHLPARELWPDMAWSLPELQYPARMNCVGELLDVHRGTPVWDQIVLRDATSSWTYAELHTRVCQIAHVLTRDMGLVPGNRVLLRGTNTLMMAACFLATIRAGGIAVPTMPLLRAKELGVMIDKAQISHALCADSLRDELLLAAEAHPTLSQRMFFNGGEDSMEQHMRSKPPVFAPVDTAADDVCLIGFTSGTTGKPKATMHFHRDMMAICDCFPRSTLKARADDVFIGTPPLAFTFGLGGLLLFPMRFGASAVLLEKLTPELLLRAIQQYRATVCFTAPTFYRQMAMQAKQFDLSSLRETVSAGEMLPVSTRQAWQQATGLRMIDGIGATEMLHIFISASGDAVRAGATGKPIPGYQACVMDDSGQIMGPGKIGRLAVKGPTGCRYLDDERQSAYVINGWNVTGDAYETDQDGYFWYRARTDDMIISAGYNIAGPEVEDAVLMHPAVAECAVIGVEDEARGQIVKAYIVLKPETDASDELAVAIQEFVKQTIAPYKYPRQIEFRKQLPRTETGKLQRFRLREQPQSGSPVSTPEVKS